MKSEIHKFINYSDSISKAELNYIVGLLNSDRTALKELIVALFHKNSRELQRVGLVLSKLANEKPDLFEGYTEMMFENLYHVSSDAIKRNVLRVLQYVKIPKNQHDAAVDICFQYLENRREAVAIQVFAMTVLANIVNEYPELKNELLILLEDGMQNGSAGFKSRAQKTIKLLS